MTIGITNQQLPLDPALGLHGVKRSYFKITEKDVVDVIMKTAHDWNGAGIISPSNISRILKSSRYQVDKHIKSLRSKNLLTYKSMLLGKYEDFYPPYNGYCLSELGKSTYSEELKELSEKERKLIRDCFGI